MLSLTRTSFSPADKIDARCGLRLRSEGLGRALVGGRLMGRREWRVLMYRTMFAEEKSMNDGGREKDA